MRKIADRDTHSVLFVNYSRFGDGSTVSLWRIAEWVAHRGLRAGIAGAPNHWLRERLVGSTVAFHPADIPMLRRSSSPAYYAIFLLRFLRATLSIFRIIQRAEYRVIHVNTSPNLAGILGALAAGRSPLWHVHELRIQSPTAFRLLRLFPRFLASVVICPSRAVAAQFPSRKKLLLPNVVPDRWLDRPCENFPNLHARLGLGRGGTIMLWVGGIAPRKGLDRLLSALESWPQEEYPAGLAIVCDVADRYRPLFTELNRSSECCRCPVRFFEKVTEVRPWYCAADLLVQTSLMPEAFGLTVLEGMAGGASVVCPASGGMAEFVRHGISAHVVDPGDPAALREALMLVAGNRAYAARLAEGGKRTARQFTASAVLPRLLEVYKQIESAEGRKGARSGKKLRG